jgi:ATP-dependent protease ClpP protease subunit
MGQGYSIRSKGSKDAPEILIYEDIGQGWFSDDGVTAKQFATDLKALGKVPAIDVRINSYGGAVNDGNAIYNRLIENGAKITTYIDGVAASIASVIAMAGEEIVIAENAWMMIHDAWGVAIGNARELRRQADLMDSMSATAADVYSARTRQPRDKVLSMMGETTWMSAAEAIDLGFATRMTENLRIAAIAKPSAIFSTVFRHLPEALGGDAPARSSAMDDEERAIRSRVSEAATRMQRARLLTDFRARANSTGPQ